MPRAKFILHVFKIFLLCIAALNTACWSTARLCHELHDHRPQVFENHTASHGIAIVSGEPETHHGACSICVLFQHLHPDGTCTVFFTCSPQALLVLIHLEGHHIVEGETISGWPVRAPPFFS
ncbi:MAG TPA: hypothetical protein DEB50_02955 [Desulfobacter sp.]|nr:hypothetical protein [Desulfobacter sp.]